MTPETGAARVLTARQAEILAWFTDYVRREGLPPTMREVGAHFRFTPRGAWKHLNAIAAKGHLRRRVTTGRPSRMWVLCAEGAGAPPRRDDQ